MNPSQLIGPSAWRTKLVNHLSLERNVTLASAAVFIIGLGEELWKKFIPKYLERESREDSLKMMRMDVVFYLHDVR